MSSGISISFYFISWSVSAANSDAADVDSIERPDRCDVTDTSDSKKPASSVSDWEYCTKWCCSPELALIAEFAIDGENGAGCWIGDGGGRGGGGGGGSMGAWGAKTNGADDVIEAVGRGD